MKWMRKAMPIIVALGVSGCAALKVALVAGVHPGPIAETSSDLLPSSESPTLEYQNPFGGWQEVSGGWISIPGTAGAMQLRVRLKGRTVSVEGNYDGQPIEIGPPCWCFTVWNSRDGGNHPLYVTVTYHDIGETPRQFVASFPYLVMNNSGY